ncbi:hypothetical protein E4T42_04352 [Aureobasidium subglaciale]|nr:hypothetical protein E4T42_04352 [Aureobasidium subglaciale]
MGNSPPARSGGVTFKLDDPDFVGDRKSVDDFHGKIQNLLLRKDYHGLIEVFRSAENENLDFVRNIPENTFSEILAHLRPENTLTWATESYSQLSPAMVTQLHLPSVDHLIREHLLDTVKLLDEHSKSSKTLSVVDYGLILGFTRWTGLRCIAESFWASMHADNVVPDLKCYNNYLGAIVSNLRHDPDARHSRRLNAYRTKARSRETPSARHAAYRFGNRGIKQEVMDFHREMVKNGIVPDEETFRLLILGVSREGDLDTVKKILRQVWSIDVDAVVGDLDAGDAARELRISPTSPLYPTPSLVYAIAHAFGINNDIPTALRLVDHVSRTYNIKVPDYVWHELFNWTFVLSRPRQASRNEQTYLAKASVKNIWDVMRNQPYKVQPTIDMYNKLIKSLFKQQRTKDMWYYMCEALPLYEAMRTKTRELYETLRNALGPSGTDGDETRPIGRLHQEYAQSRLAQKSARLWLKRWVRLLLATMHTWRKVDRDLFWSTIQIPKVILEWQEFMPSNAWYDISAGRVDITLRTWQEKVSYQTEIMDVMDLNDRVLDKGGLLKTHDGNRYILSRRQQRAAARLVYISEQSKVKEGRTYQIELQPDHE